MDIIEEKKDDDHNIDMGNTPEHHDIAIKDSISDGIGQRKFQEKDIEELRKQSLEMQKGRGGSWQTKSRQGRKANKKPIETVNRYDALTDHSIVDTYEDDLEDHLKEENYTKDNNNYSSDEMPALESQDLMADIQENNTHNDSEIVSNCLGNLLVRRNLT
ncbi:hypothetical protein K7X08_023837 [Anisodus acutangulus]|uniref:Uncharacterized protein n=1 Tax=Anisodus acutangulus TaxID=402998 RepID=A0A9Q1L8V2_9SOLA|nr:hypothetical protein K7X08_023837 [Anisodus acutangulus]